MNKRYHVLALVILLASLITGTVVSGAQSPLTETYTWQPHGLTVQYPNNWTVVQKDAAISLRPANRDVTDGHGPELVLFDLPDAQPDQLDAALRELANRSGAAIGLASRGSLNGYETYAANLSWTNPNAMGMMTLIVLDDQTVIGAAYVVRSTEAGTFLPVLQQIEASIMLGGVPAAVASTEISSGVASVQLPQRYVWEDTGLVLNLPAAWLVELESDEGWENLVVTPDQDQASGDERYRLIQATTLAGTEGLDLRALAQAASGDYEVVSEFEDVTIAGQPGVTFEILDDSSEPVLRLRSLILTLPNSRVAMIVFSTHETAWEGFRPFVSAISSSIEFADGSTSAIIPGEGSLLTLVARDRQAAPAPWRQDTPEQYVWEEYGIGFTLPEGWKSFNGDGQDYDLALVSPEAVQGDEGAFITLRGFVGLTLGGNTLESALQPVADDLEAKIETYTIAGAESKAIFHESQDEGALRSFILMPYDTRGDVIYIQTTAPLAVGDEAIKGILDSITINPLQVDYAAVDAAWQTSLAEQGKLIVGDPDAPIKLREFLSFTCGHCVNYSRAVERLIALEVETGRVQYEFSALAGDEPTLNATYATYCAAEQGKGYTVSEALFQGYLAQGLEVAYSRAGIDDLLEPLGVDLEALNACIESGKYNEAVNAVRLDFNDQGLTGTPTIAFGVGDDAPVAIVLPSGEIWSGAIPLSYLRNIIGAVADEGMTIEEYFAQ